MNEPAMVERKAKRVIPSRPITVAVQHDAGHLAYGVVVNISVGGVCVLTDTVLPLGQSLQVELSFPQHDRTVHAPGRTVWVGSQRHQAVRCGLQFSWPRSPEGEFNALIREIEC